MSKNLFTDKQLLSMIRGTEPNRLRALKYLYQEAGWISIVTRILINEGVQEAEIKDATQEAFIIFDNNIRSFKYEGKGTLKNYFIGICKGRVYSNIRSVKRQVLKGDSKDLDKIESITPEVIMLEKEKKEMMRKAISQLGAPCKTVLHLYQLSYTMKEIAKAIGKSEGMAKKMSYTCRKKLRTLISTSPLLKKYLNR